MTSIRDKFRGSKISSLKETRKDAEQKSKSAWSNSNRPGFLDINEGRNIFKLAPPHDPDHPAYRPKRVAWLECEVEERDEDGKETGTKKVVNKPIFIATVHSDIEGLEDPIELYIEMVRQQVFDSIDDPKEREKKLYPITGYRDSSKKWHPGMRPSTNYVAYAWKNGELGRVEFYPQIVKKIEELNISSDTDGEVMEIDCFSDIDSGIYLVIDYDKSAKSGDKYKVNKDSLDFAYYQRKYGERGIDVYKEDFEKRRVTEKQLTELAEKESLTDMYVGVYSKRDFELAIDGLNRFDKKHGYNLFDNEEFLEKLVQIESLVPEKETKSDDDAPDTDTEDSGTETTQAQPDVTQTSSSNGFDSWPEPKLVRYLKQYIVDAYDGTEELPSLSKEDMVEWCILASEGKSLPFPKEELKATVAIPPKEVKQEDKPNVTRIKKDEPKPEVAPKEEYNLNGHADASSTKDAIAAIRARRNAAKDAK